MMRLTKRAVLGLLPVIVVALLSACSSGPRKDALTSSQLQSASISGLTDIRFVPSSKSGTEAFVNEVKSAAVRRSTAWRVSSNYLSLSGGGDNGAFGAGLLVGWSKQGTRPEFKQVVGISTGALIAPLAFLGSDYDPVLEDVFTNVTPSDIYRERGTSGILFSDAYADNSPLADLIRRKVDQNMLQRIAQEYEIKGRLLLIGTTNIDTGQLIIWNMGKIAGYKTPESADLFHRIMLASAAIPGAFPPSLFEVSVDGKSFHELHVDGGLAVQIYLYPAAAGNAILAESSKDSGKRTAYIIRNARISLDQAKTERNGLDIVNRALKKMIQAQGVGNLYQIHEIAQRDRIGFKLAFIGDDFSFDHPTEFDQAYMRALFQYGYNKAASGYPWNDSPPGFEHSTEEDIKAQSRR